MKPFTAGMFLSVIVLISGCASAPTSTTTPNVPPKSGTINTPNVIIRAEDGSFTLKSGETFVPPFYSQYPLSDNTGPQRAENWVQALKAGGRRVIVEHGPDTLHGVLTLNYHYPNMTSVGAYTYQIEIPQQFVEAAKFGRTVVYELTPVPNGGESRFLSWTLWLSSQPYSK